MIAYLIRETCKDCGQKYDRYQVELRNLALICGKCEGDNVVAIVSRELIEAPKRLGED